MGRLSTHVLDIANGTPARSVRIELYAINGEERRKVADVFTNADGRTDAPLMSADGFGPGTYELLFHAGDYFRRLGAGTADPPFLDIVPVRFHLAEPDGHYHVPLLVSPFACASYRGS